MSFTPKMNRILDKSINILPWAKEPGDQLLQLEMSHDAHLGHE